MKSFKHNPLKILWRSRDFHKDMPKVWQWRVHTSSLVIDLFCHEADVTGIVHEGREHISVLYFFLKFSLARLIACSYWLYFLIQSCVISNDLFCSVHNSLECFQVKVVLWRISLTCFLNTVWSACSVWLVLSFIFPWFFFGEYWIFRYQHFWKWLLKQIDFPYSVPFRVKHESVFLYSAQMVCCLKWAMCYSENGLLFPFFPSSFT